MVAAHRGFPFPLSLLPNRLQRILGRVPALAARLRGAPPSTRQCPETLCAHDALSSAMAPWLGTVEDATGMGVIFCEAWIMRPTLAPAPHTLTSLSSDLQRLRLGLPSSRSGARGACYVEALFEGDRLVECVFDGPEDFMEAAPATLTAWGQRHRRFLREIGRLRLATTLAPLSAHDLAKLLTAGRT